MKTHYTITSVLATSDKILAELFLNEFDNFKEALNFAFDFINNSNVSILDSTIMYRMWIHQQTINEYGEIIGECRFLVENNKYKPEN